MPRNPRLAEDEDEREERAGILRRLLKARSILVSETVTDRTARKVQTQLILLQQEDETSPVTVYINSPGGSADSGFAIYDALRFFRPPVRTIVTGLCASAAVLIHLAAPRERRYALPHARFLLHQPSTIVVGSASDIQISAEEIVRLRERYNRIVAQETGKTVEQVTKDADRDFWLSPEEALQYGLVGRILKSHAELA